MNRSLDSFNKRTLGGDIAQQKTCVNRPTLSFSICRMVTCQTRVTRKSGSNSWKDFATSSVDIHVTGECHAKILGKMSQRLSIHVNVNKSGSNSWKDFRSNVYYIKVLHDKNGRIA